MLVSCSTLLLLSLDLHGPAVSGCLPRFTLISRGISNLYINYRLLMWIAEKSDVNSKKKNRDLFSWKRNMYKKRHFFSLCLLSRWKQYAQLRSGVGDLGCSACNPCWQCKHAANWSSEKKKRCGSACGGGISSVMSVNTHSVPPHRYKAHVVCFGVISFPNMERDRNPSCHSSLAARLPSASHAGDVYVFSLVFTMEMYDTGEIAHLWFKPSGLQMFVWTERKGTAMTRCCLLLCPSWMQWHYAKGLYCNESRCHGDKECMRWMGLHYMWQTNISVTSVGTEIGRGFGCFTYFGVSGEQLEGLVHLPLFDASAEVQEVGWFPSVQVNDVASGHGQTSSIHWEDRGFTWWWLCQTIKNFVWSDWWEEQQQ